MRLAPALCRAALAGALLLLPPLCAPADLAAQQRTGPWVGGGVGATTRLEEADYSIVERVGPAGWIRGGLALESGHLLGVEWSRGWYDSPLTRVDRQSMLVVLQWPLGPGGDAHLRVGAGLGIGTVVRIEPDAPGDAPGDRVVSIGDEGGPAAVVGFSWRVPIRGRSWLALNPGLDLGLQRVDGEVQAGVTASVGLLVGRGFGRPGRDRRPEG